MTCVSVAIAGQARLRSADRYDIVIPRVRTAIRQRLRAAAPNIWNLLPMTVRNTNSREQFIVLFYFCCGKSAGRIY